jgi:hypothetical protein
VVETVRGKYLESGCVQSPRAESRGADHSPSSQRLILRKDPLVIVRPSQDWHFESTVVTEFGLERAERYFPEQYWSSGGRTTSAS